CKCPAGREDCTILYRHCDCRRGRLVDRDPRTAFLMKPDCGQRFAFPRRISPGSCQDRASRKAGGRRECRMQAAPMARLQQKTQAAVTTGPAEATGIPCAMALQLIARSPRGTGLIAPVSLRIDPARLDPGIGRS